MKICSKQNMCCDLSLRAILRVFYAATLLITLTAISFISNIAMAQADPQTIDPSLNNTDQARSLKTKPASIKKKVQRKRPQTISQKSDIAANSNYDRMVEQANSKTVTVVSGTVNGTYIVLANDMSFVLDEPDKIRVLPVIGRGGYENIYDILLLRGIDTGLVRSDALAVAKKENKVSDIANRLSYISVLANDELHVIAPENIKTLEDLRGKRVNLDIKGSGTSLTGKLVFERLGIEIQPSFHDAAAAYIMLAKGELDAAFYISPKPVRAIANIPASAKLHLVEIPYDKRLEDVYYPSTFDSADYPNLLLQNKPVNTIAAKSILVTYNWGINTERYQRVERFVDAFFSKIDEFRKPNRHPKWKEVSLSTTFQGLPRFKAATDWLERDAKPSNDNEIAKAQLRQFLEERATNTANNKPSAALSAEEQDKVFEEFSRWRQNKKQ
jgi:uncharacterized protein